VTVTLYLHKLTHPASHNNCTTLSGFCSPKHIPQAITITINFSDKHYGEGRGETAVIDSNRHFAVSRTDILADFRMGLVC
jgi:hypothetical protein